MSRARTAAFAYTALAMLVVGFQLALAGGAPWGEFAMGGANVGVLPRGLRIAAGGQAVFNAWLAVVVLTRAGVLAPRWAPGAPRLIWVVVALGALGTLMNLLTPSAGERLRWAPVALGLLLTSLVVARSPLGRTPP